jgi:hypothetical protein
MIFRVFFINNEDYPNANEVSLAISVEKMPLPQSLQATLVRNRLTSE